MAELRTQRDLTERGEHAIIDALLSLPAGFILLPHLHLPGQTWPEAADDLDVVVLGPGGAALLAYHHWQGTLLGAPDPATWRQRFPGGGEEERANPISVMEGKATALAGYLAARGVVPPRLLMALVFPERTGLDGTSGATTLSTATVASWLESELARSEDAPGLDPSWTKRAADQIRPPSPARLVNQYQVMSVLDRQPDRTTYLAFDTLSGRRVVLRELPYDPYQEPEQLDKVRKELLREAKLTMELDHPGVVRVERVIPKDDRYYVVSEYLEGCQTLRQRLAQAGPPLESEALAIAIGIAGALINAHGKGIVHRDIRPENILLAAGAAKLSNFGLAKKVELGTRPTFDLRKLATESPYSAPELRLGHEAHHRADGRADVYSLGVVLYEMLTGQLPAHLDEKYWEPPGQFVRDLSPGLDDAVHKAMRFDPLQRFSTMNALRERLLQVRDRLSEHPDSPRLRYGDRRLARRTPNSLVYRAQDTKFMRAVALKRVLIDPALTPEAHKQLLEAILREAALASHLIHPAIVHILDHFVEDDDGYIVMEWLEGQSLRDLLEARGGQLPVEETLDLAEQIAGALAHAHASGVIHRDIKPENVMVHHGRATLLDFGIAAIPGWTAREQGIGGGDPAALIVQRAPTGTARYIAPEILAGQEFDGRADVFSLGVTLHEILTGRYPYAAETILGNYAPHLLETGLTAASALNLEVSAQLSSVVARAIAVDPAERLESVEALREALDRVRGKRGAGRRPGVSKVVAVTAGVALFGAVSLGSILVLGPFMTRYPRTEEPAIATPAATDDAQLGLASDSATATPLLPAANMEATTAPQTPGTPVPDPAPSILPQAPAPGNGAPRVPDSPAPPPGQLATQAPASANQAPAAGDPGQAPILAQPPATPDPADPPVAAPTDPQSSDPSTAP